MKKYILILIIMLSTLSSAFYISPDGFGKRVDEGAVQEYTFKNDTGKTVRYRFKMLPGSDGRSMHEWIEFEPKVMTIKNAESKKLKVFVKSPPGTPVGDYNFYMNVETVTLPNTLGNTKEGTAAAGSTVGLSINIEMIGWVGDLPAQLKLEKYEFETKEGILHLKGFVNNRTEKRFVRYMLDIIGNNGQRETFYGGVVNAKDSRNINVPLPKFKKKSDIWKIEVKETLDRNLLQTIAF
ncbi:hypothetical protein [Cetobacterium sp.]|uniref:hypothetical protein n=1 Tax=Cetobacterium sp. TaxID=2071632 RepID=UPI003F3BB7F2